tara:strand:- start:651 stop:920 length:270 start_codon:yes stop_codon:yes gene_type:complete
MATVFIPSLMIDMTSGKQRIEVPGSNVRDIINSIDKLYPGVKGRLVENYKIKPNISVAVDGEISPLGILEKVGPNSEVHFIPAVGGGAN